MSAVVLRGALGWGALALVILFPAVQEAGLRLAARRARAMGEEARAARPVLVWTLSRLTLGSAGLFLLPGGVWALVHLGAVGAHVFLGLEAFLAFAVLAVGLTAITLRLRLRLAAAAAGSGGPLFLAGRLAVWLIGSAYALAGGRLLVGDPPRALLSVFLVGAALIALGLNRTKATVWT